MALENAGKFLERMMTDEALRARVAAQEPAGVVEIAKELGFTVTVEELQAAEKELRRAPENGEKPVELDVNKMDKIVGGAGFLGEDAPDGHEMGCFAFYHHYNYQKENNIWCNKAYYCNHSYQIEPDWDTES